MANDLTRPIVCIENRTAQEVFDIMVDRFQRTPPPQSHSRVRPLTKTQIETLANNIHNVDEWNYTVECLTHHLSDASPVPSRDATLAATSTEGSA
ncbi:hypothetical protein J2T08_000524 [Neorhizobium galegae]|uniref:hypothetical protein n=1 Tax=Neorhizobium galegae TaxID=399 RepID=UPI0027825C93|nr:hypothetical protein [Neorhizobium galegae]MDQ0132623.1 hypothetical protein [Neorhizobium galegae]